VLRGKSVPREVLRGKSVRGDREVVPQGVVSEIRRKECAECADEKRSKREGARDVLSRTEHGQTDSKVMGAKVTEGEGRERVRL
jgi:hypothetical protein